MSEIIWHRHHLVPKHIGGDDSKENLIKVNVAMHAFLHQQLWLEHNRAEDYAAWQGLLGNKEAIKSLGATGFSGKHHKDSSKKKISDSLKGNELTWKPWENSPKNLKGKENDDLVSACIDKGMTAKQISEETGILHTNVYRIIKRVKSAQ